MANIKRTNTAELRRLFANINHLLEEGYNHKQICTQLNSQGMAIPYAQYRAIMSRLRRESAAGLISCTSSNHALPGVRQPSVQDIPEVGLMNRGEDASDPAKEKKFSWDPGSKITNW